MVNGAQQIAGGVPGGVPQGVPPQQQGQVSPGGAAGFDQQKLLQVLSQIMQQAVDPNGYLDMTKVASLWPQAAQAAGLNIPFETMLQILQQNPELIQDLVVQLGLNGIILEGQIISAEQLANVGTGGGAPTQSQPAPQGVGRVG